MRSLSYGTKLEVNFVVKKFLELPAKEKKRLYALTKKKDEKSMVEVGVSLLALLVKNSEEMGKFAGPFDLWPVFPDDAPHKAALFWKYFRDNLIKVKGDICINPAT